MISLVRVNASHFPRTHNTSTIPATVGTALLSTTFKEQLTVNQSHDWLHTQQTPPPCLDWWMPHDCLHKLAGREGPFKRGFSPDTTNKTHNAGRSRKWLAFTKVEHTVRCIESESIVCNNTVPTVAGLVAELWVLGMLGKWQAFKQTKLMYTYLRYRVSIHSVRGLRNSRDHLTNSNP